MPVETRVHKITRRSFLRSTIITSAMLSLGACGKTRSLKLGKKPNLLVLLPDQVRADIINDVAATGVHAPNIRRLASQSVVFERAYVTHPVCTPSRSSLLTGTWPHQSGCRNNKAVLPRQFRCLPEMVADSDYRTAYFGKWNL